MRNGHIRLLIMMLALPLTAFHTLQDTAHTLTFRVLKGNDRIGVLKVQRKTEGGRLTYGLVSWVNIQLLMHVEVKEYITDVFDQGMLLHSSHQRYINGSLKQNHVLKKSAAAYTWHDQDDHFKVLADSITCSILALYFNEPLPGQWVYSQNFGVMLQVNKTQANTYSLQLPNGNNSVYRYKESALQEVETSTFAGTLKFVLEK